MFDILKATKTPKLKFDPDDTPMIQLSLITVHPYENQNAYQFKLNKSPEEALKQIHDKGYFQKFINSDKEVILVGANFSTKTRNIESWKIEKLKY
jgi:hypothetical protein